MVSNRSNRINIGHGSQLWVVALAIVIKGERLRRGEAWRGVARVWHLTETMRGDVREAAPSGGLYCLSERREARKGEPGKQSTNPFSLFETM